MTKAPTDLSAGGAALWAAVTKAHPGLDAAQLVQLLEACRAKDRLDKLDLVLRGDADCWMRLTHRVRTDDYALMVDDALTKANATANVMKQLLAAMRLPDQVSGKRPQLRAARGAYKAGGTGSVKDRLRAV